MRRTSGTCNSTEPGSFDQSYGHDYDGLIMLLEKVSFLFLRESLRFTSEWRFGTWLAIATAWQRMGVLDGFWTMFGLREHGSRRKHDRTSLEAFFELPPSKSQSKLSQPHDREHT